MSYNPINRYEKLLIRNEYLDSILEKYDIKLDHEVYIDYFPSDPEAEEIVVYIYYCCADITVRKYKHIVLSSDKMYEVYNLAEALTNYMTYLVSFTQYLERVDSWVPITEKEPPPTKPGWARTSWAGYFKIHQEIPEYYPEDYFEYHNWSKVGIHYPDQAKEAIDEGRITISK